MKRVCLLVFMLMLAGCLRFGKDVELSGAAFTGEYLQEITRLTGVRFPEGSVGVEYYYLGDGIDPALAAKIEIPKEKKDEFLSNDIFQKGRDERPHFEIGSSKKWWRLESLKSRIDRAQNLSNARFLECSLGEEEGRHFVYLSWITT